MLAASAITTVAQADLYLGMPKDTATVQALERMKAAGDIMECGGPALCGVVALESGYGEGYYAAETTTVHGLWPENQPYGTSICAAVGDTAEVPDYAWVKVSLPLEEPPLKTAPLIHHEPGHPALCRRMPPATTFLPRRMPTARRTNSTL